MSYNIDTFKVKEILDLIIPVASLYKCEREDWHPDRMNNDDGTVTFTNMETEIHGAIKGGSLFVDKIDCRGEGSGTVMNWMLGPAFKDSTGRLVASCVWEGGDSINQLIVDDGNVEWKGIDI